LKRWPLIKFNEYFSASNLHEPLQPAHTSNHSSEIAFFKVSNDILQALDNTQCVYMLFCDLSLASHTMNLDTFLSHFKSEYGIMGNVAGWKNSYLAGRYQFVDVNGNYSEKPYSLQEGKQGQTIGCFWITIGRSYKINV